MKALKIIGGISLIALTLFVVAKVINDQLICFTYTDDDLPIEDF